MLKSLFISLLPVPVFYLIYYRHFIGYYRSEGKKAAYLKHLEAFLSGAAVALAIVLFSSYLEKIFPSSSIIYEAFIKAALIEKAGAFVIIFIIQRNYPGFNMLEAVVSGILVGTGFSLVENVLYSLNYGNSVILPRVLFSAPLHITTCGLIGYFTGLFNLSSTGLYRISNILKALIFPFILHGLYDVLLLNGGSVLYLVGPIIIAIAGILELYISWSKVVPSREALALQNLRFEDWKLKQRQPRYERWILNSMGTSSSVIVPFFSPYRGKLLWTFVIIFFAAGGIFFPLRHEIAGLIGNLKPEEEILIASIFPVSIGFILSIVGSVNSKFFTSSVVSLPVIFDVVMRDKDSEQYFATFDITHANAFLITFEPINFANGAELYFEMPGLKSINIKFKVIWENHHNKEGEPAGSIIEILDPGIKFYLFLIRYYLFRFRKGIVYNLKLPGFQAIRRLFLHPSTVMQREIIYRPGTRVFSQGDEVNTFYYIKKGKVDIYKELVSGKRIHIDTMEAGQIFNEMALLGDKRRSVTAECQTVCILAEADVDNLEALIRYNPDFACALVKKLAQRADQTQEYLTQTIEYLQSLVEINTRKSQNVSILLALTLGNIPLKDRKSFEFEVDADAVCRDLDLKPAEIIDYINSSLSFRENNQNMISAAKAAQLEKMLSEYQVKLVNKNEKPVLSFSLKIKN
ncbi:MAG: cyclic nucleotide-binding domain-containing protein [Spirochaetota bacterium]